VVGIPTRSYVEIDFIAQASRRHDRILLVLSREILKGLVLVGIDHSAFFDPADLVLFGFDPEETAPMLKHLEGLSVDNFADAVGDSCYTIVQVHLPSSDVDHFTLVLPQPFAARGEQERKYQEQSGKFNRRVLAAMVKSS
jgi:hypothetical protein